MNLPEIAIIDDQPAVCKEVATLLRSEYIVHAFRSGREGIAFLEKNHVDLILLDYYMPEQTGFEVLLEMRQNKFIADTPVVFLTSETNDRMELEMEQRGAADYLLKPVNAGALRTVLSNLIKKK